MAFDTFGTLGFGCMGITAFYGKSMEDEACTALLKEVFDMGYSHFDTAEVYRQDDKVNEVQIGAFLKTLDRKSFTVATKFFPGLHENKCDKDTVATAVDRSLENLGLEYVDLYYLHRMPPTLEEAKQWMESIKTCVSAGKVKNVGLSEVPADWLPELHAIHPVTAVQQEWSLLTREIVEKELIPVYKELGIGIVAYSPLARNLLAGPPEEVTDWRANHPRYAQENYEKNKELARKIKEMAETKGKSAAQLSLAWLYHKANKLGVKMLPIPGTTKVANARDNYGAVGVELTDEEAKQLEELGATVVGLRGNESYQNMSVERFSKVRKLA
mmetsp:Transcript_68793/g.109151  ORF Transcript_68793/g.109151 Transcript_68793/m.109151 type:complete len:328 (-) Transcript_68793:179-1162(-)|eukprot:CAMPEP_0169070348 /NCGR_PEP_ID=MMETSP1015-20121227/5066_1 /TAXON_ID=342587 /ORGANISM="Karlodinium micrum, Strain CCMP2283" /LENGTH=327 /DNA_ID=CAMNT_0009129337 /DNA_START=60 /DNA_END=1043 /DNA_ORIENTATION=+